MPYVVIVTGVCMMLDKRREFKLALGVRIWCRWYVPYFEFAPETNSKVAARRREGKRGNRGLEGEVVYGDSSVDVGQDGLAIFVDCEEQVALGCKAYPRDILPVGKGKGIGFVAEIMVSKAVAKSDGKSKVAYLTRSKTVTRFPTGEYRWVPSGLNSRLPRL